MRKHAIIHTSDLADQAAGATLVSWLVRNTIDFGIRNTTDFVNSRFFLICPRFSALRLLVRDALLVLRLLVLRLRLLRWLRRRRRRGLPLLGLALVSVLALNLSLLHVQVLLLGQLFYR